MKLTIIGILIIIILMVFIQIVFRENYTSFDREKFRKNMMDWHLKKHQIVQTDGKATECNQLSDDKTRLTKQQHCYEAFGSIEQSKTSTLIENECKVANNIKYGEDGNDWRKRINALTQKTFKNSRGELNGCGFCYDNGKILFGDEKGPFPSSNGIKVCNNWLKPGGGPEGGSDMTKNLFVEYPFDKEVENPTITEKGEKFGSKGLKYDTIKMHEQDKCSKMKNCGDQSIVGADGTPLCGWCIAGRKGDGVGEGMVRKGGTGNDKNETKYDDDYCPWFGEVDAAGKKTEKWGTPTRELKIWKNAGKTLNRLIHNSGTTLKVKEQDLKQCEVLDSMFPCFPNYMGFNRDASGNPIGKHTKECYHDMWKNYTSYTGKIDNCNDIEDIDSSGYKRIEKYFGRKDTIDKWNKTFIPSVENAFKQIPKKMFESIQYNPSYIDKEGNEVNDISAKMNSAERNGKICLGDNADKNTKHFPNDCDERFRQRDYGFTRPKSCINSILQGKKVPETPAEYIPGKKDTYKYYWAVKNDGPEPPKNVWKEGIHYDWDDVKFKSEIQKKIDAIKKLTPSGMDEGNKNNVYDDALVAALYLNGKLPTKNKPDYGKINLNGEEYKTKLWIDNKGTTNSNYPWVKMCWEDFRYAMKKKYANNDRYFITKDGKLRITKIKKNGKLLSDLIAPENDEDNFYHRILTITKKGILGDKKEEVQLLKDSTNIYITKNNYEHDYFPFWRLLDPEQYVTTKYDEYQSKTREEQDMDKSKFKQNKQRRGNWRETGWI
jgi:hypothetical protein